MGKTLDEKVRIVLLYIEGIMEGKEICATHNVPLRTFRRWVSRYRNNGIKGLEKKKPGVRPVNSIPKSLEERIVKLKQKHPSWGARRIKYQYDLPCHWMTVHRVIKSNGMLVRIKPKPQPSKRFQWRHVDPLFFSPYYICAVRFHAFPHHLISKLIHEFRMARLRNRVGRQDRACLGKPGDAL